MHKQVVAIIGWTAALAVAASAAEKTMNLSRNAKSGVDSRLAYSGRWDRNCKTLPVKITFTRQPANGTATYTFQMTPDPGHPLPDRVVREQRRQPGGPGTVPLHRRAAEWLSAARARSGRASRTGRIRRHASSRLAGMYSVGQYPSCGR